MDTATQFVRFFFLCVSVIGQVSREQRGVQHKNETGAQLKMGNKKGIRNNKTQKSAEKTAMNAMNVCLPVCSVQSPR